MSAHPQLMSVPITGIEIHSADGQYRCGYVGWGSNSGTLRTRSPRHLGFCFNPERAARRGIIWDAAFGYVSGFPISAILWFLLTRSIPSETLVKRILAWEKRTGRYDSNISWVPRGEPVALRSLALAESLVGAKQ